MKERVEIHNAIHGILYSVAAASRAREKPPRLHAQRQGRPNTSLRPEAVPSRPPAISIPRLVPTRCGSASRHLHPAPRSYALRLRPVPCSLLRRDEAVLEVLEDEELVLGVLGLVVLLEQRVRAAQLVRRVEVDLVVLAWVGVGFGRWWSELGLELG